MLGKMYISSTSDPEKLNSALDLTAEAIDGKIAADAAGRNALNKLHTALGKALGENAKPAQSRAQEGLTVVEEDGVEVAEGAESGQGEETKVEAEEGKTEVGDSLLEELLEDEEE